MANIQGTVNPLPGAYTNVTTQSNAVNVPGGIRTAVILGEGYRTETVVSSALGAGKDGLDPTYSTTKGSDGRHFSLTYFPVISNRTTLFKNGIPLVGYENPITTTFSSLFDYELDITTGHIQLQSASIVDQGGTFFTAGQLNVGNGTINGLSLLDLNAPTETWTVKCSTVLRDGYGNPIDGYARFIAQGSVSGILLDGYGNQIIWQSNGTTLNNTILSFSITEGSTAFREGDKFTVMVQSGTLVKGDSLTATYISEADINDPEFFTDMDLLVTKHGVPSLVNRLSLGAQLSFANGTPGVWACETAPSIPRRVSYELETSASGGVTSDDLEFPLPLNIIPDVDSDVHFFITDPSTGVETQILPNKVAFYNAGYTTSPNTFMFGSLNYSYTVVLEEAVDKRSQDGVITSIGPTSATISSQLVGFTSTDVGKTLKVLHPDLNANTYTIVSATNGVATISNGISSFTHSTMATFEVLDSTATSATILLTKDLALSAGQSLRVTVIDVKDAPFFDVGWEAALAAIETIECDIVVPLPSQTISAIFAASEVHCINMSNTQNRKERVLFIGAINGLTPDNVTGVTPAAVESLGPLEGIHGNTVQEILSGDIEDLTNYSVPNSYGNTFRVVYFYPDQIVVQIGGSQTIVDGFFLAPAAAGFLSGTLNVAIPLTNKILTGFSILRNRLFRPLVLQNLAVAGITTLQPAIGGGTVVWGLTTSQSGAPEEQEISIVFIRDRIAKSFRAAFASYAGTAESSTLQGSLMARANAVCQSFISQGLITAFANLKVVRDSIDPTQYDVSVAVQPNFPVNFISISVSVGVI
jgi:hypothetical protein